MDSSPWFAEALIDEENTDTNVISPTPTMSAAAVVAVRRGLRCEFSRARTPGSPASRANGHEMNDASGRATAALAMPNPANTSTAPPPTHAMPDDTPPNSPTPISAAPAASSAAPTMPRVLMDRECAVVCRMAAIGGMRAAFRAGNSAETIVTTMPSPMATTSVLVWNTSPPAGRFKPNASRRACSPRATSSPMPTPSADARMPTTPASAMTDAVTCRGLAPSDRNSPYSRVCWATMIVKVLKIRNAPTNIAMRANTSSAVEKNPM
jgi:hypothetical protein